jgi:putative hydrolase of HD superfamily
MDLRTSPWKAPPFVAARRRFRPHHGPSQRFIGEAGPGAQAAGLGRYNSGNMSEARLVSQIRFLVDADRLKAVLRRTPLVDASRQENSAEHSWHMILAAMVMKEYVEEPLDVVRVLEMTAVHDLVEIDAGDTFAYDAAANESKAERERAAADRIFGQLPVDQAVRLRELWEEFEGHATPESRFANALDRLQPLLQNAYAGGGSWSTHDVSRAQVLRRMAPIETTMPALWPFVIEIVDAFCSSGAIRASE